MTNETWKSMQPNDAVDTAEIAALLRAFWALQNIARPFPDLAAIAQDTLFEIECYVTVLRADAIARHRKSYAHLVPREPLPAVQRFRLPSIPLAEQTEPRGPASKHGATSRRIPAKIVAVEQRAKFENQSRVLGVSTHE